jgi:hypothetical protein
MRRTTASPLAVTLVLTVVMSVGLTAIGAADAARVSSHAAAAPARTVAHNGKGRLTSTIVGHTRSGHRVTGSMVPLGFSHKNGVLRVRGMINGIVHNANGSTSTFSVIRTARVKSINGVPARAGRQAVVQRTCGILHLLLRPLDLNLLGLHVHLGRVLLNIVAVSGAGNLLGNLLCAVTHLLDGGVGGLLGRLTNLLNRILGVLRLGV